VYYAHKREDQKVLSNTATLLCFLVNCGNIRTIHEMCMGQRIDSAYDSHYVKVNACGEVYGDLIFDEYCVEEKRPILPVFSITLKIIS